MPARDTKSDEALKRAVLEAALARAATAPFGQRLLEASGKDAGVSGGELMRLFPQGPASLLAFYSCAADREMEDRLASFGLAALPVRRRISTAVLTRLAILAPHKNAARRAAAHLGLPSNLPLAAGLLYDTVDAMWRAAGDVSTDFDFYTKRASLAGVYTATLMCWFNDTSADGHVTEAFLAARIENVLQYERLKARMRKHARDCFAGIASAARRWQERKTT